MSKRILINHPEKMAQKDHLRNVRQKLEGKTIQELRQEVLNDLIQYFASQMGCLQPDGKLKFN
jgi:hypothetical protein